MKKLVIMFIILFTLCILINIPHADNCECETCWAELERIEHMYE